MEPSAMLAQLVHDGAALLAASGNLDAEVPSCPGWTVRDLLLHTGTVYAHKRAIIEGGLDAPPQPWPPDFVIDDEREWFDGELHALVESLRRRDPATKVWTWYPPEQTVGFWVRRMMQETVIHRADAELASGAPSRVDDEVAIDGIDELLVRFLAFDTEGYADQPGSGERVAVTCGDTDWLVTLGPDAATVVSGGGASDAEVSGPPSDLLLALWNRLPYDAVTTSGAADALAALRAAIRATTQ